MKTDYKLKWLLLLCILVVISIIVDEAGVFMFPASTVLFKILYFSISLAVMLLFFNMAKRFRKTTEELKKSNEKLNNIFQSLSVAIWSHDLKSNRLFVTPGVENLYGRPLNEFYEDHDLWKKVIHPDDDYVLVQREQQFKVGEPLTSVYRIIRPDGEVRWIQDRGIPTLDEHNEFIDFTSVLFDITDRKESEDLYRSLVEMSPDIIAVISEDKVDYINTTGSKMVGAENPSEVIGGSIWQFVSPEAVPLIQSRLNVTEYE